MHGELVSDFDFDLPEGLIAQHPPGERGSSRMLAFDRVSGGVTDSNFSSLPDLLQPGDLLVLNDSRVLPARLFAVRAGLSSQAGSPPPSGVVEVLLVERAVEPAVDRAVEPAVERAVDRVSDRAVDGSHDAAQQRCEQIWQVLVKPARKVRVGETLHFYGPGEDPRQPVLTAEVIAAGEFGERTLRFTACVNSSAAWVSSSAASNDSSATGVPSPAAGIPSPAAGADFYDLVSRIGHMPLPPYIHRDQAARPDAAQDLERYQTVYSEQLGSAAAPTAGLHFTAEILAALGARGVEVAYLTLHVGLGTFQPVRVERLDQIRLHAERYTLPEATADALNRALAEGRRIVAVGTTTTRTLEHIALQRDEGAGPGEQSGRIVAHSGSTSIFLAPGHRFRVVGGLLTNFHLPGSTLLMLVAAFAGDGPAAWASTDLGRQRALAAYAHAIRSGYRFYSYGDCMLML